MAVSVFLLLVLAGSAAAMEARGGLLTAVLRGANPLLIPKPNNTTPVVLDASFFIISLAKVDPSVDEVDVILWTQYGWNDPSLKWDPADWDDIASIHVPTDRIWTPDTVFYNLRRPSQILSPAIAAVTSDGDVIYVPSERISFGCNLDGIETEAGVNCTLKLGSWTYSGADLDLRKAASGGAILSEYMRGTKYDVAEANSNRDVAYYACCVEPYIDIKLKMNIKTRQ